MNANDIIEAALKLCGILAAGETMTAADGQDGFAALNNMIDRWRAERLTCYQVNPYTFDLTASDGSYTIGPAGNWVVDPAPIWIENASVVDNSGAVPFEMPVEILTPQRWAQLITLKTLTSTFPFSLYYQRSGGNAGVVNIWPVPTDATYDIRLYLPVPLAQFANRTTDVNLLPGYAEALIYQLARRLAPMYGRQLDPLVLDNANEAMAVVKRTNENMDELLLDEGLVNRGTGSGWNYYTGDWTR